MRKAFTSFLIIFVLFYATAALCLCQHESIATSQATDHCHEQNKNAAPDASSHAQHFNSSHHSEEENHSCSCLEDKDLFSSRVEISSLNFDFRDFIWLFPTFQNLFSQETPFQESFKTAHNLEPPFNSPLYFQKSSFLI